jgi:hypothetical protein
MYNRFASYWGGPGLKYRRENGLFWQISSKISLVHSGKYQHIVSKVTMLCTASCRLWLTEYLFMWFGFFFISFQNNIRVTESNIVFLFESKTNCGFSTVRFRATENLEKAKIVSPQTFINFWEFCWQYERSQSTLWLNKLHSISCSKKAQW